MTPAEVEDRADIQQFLKDRQETSMFPLMNLRDHGWDSDAPYAMRFWLRRQHGAVTDVVGVTNAGMIMPQCPTCDLMGLRDGLAGRQISGIIGLAEQAGCVKDALGLRGAPATLDRDEPLMTLKLRDLAVPDGVGEIVPLAEAPKANILRWMIDYQLEALQTPADQAEDFAAGSYERYCERGSHVALMDGDVPLAMSGFNARLPEIVQIGGVYTPPAGRNRGLARRALGLHLAQARAEGVLRSVLFSASEAARRSYEALGYRVAGSWTLCLYAEPQVIDG